MKQGHLCCQMKCNFSRSLSHGGEATIAVGHDGCAFYFAVHFAEHFAEHFVVQKCIFAQQNVQQNALATQLCKLRMPPFAAIIRSTNLEKKN